MADNTVNSMYAHLTKPRDITKYTLIRGTADFGNLAQWNLYESGYSVLVVCKIPKFLELLGEKNADYKTLMDNYVHILEYEFRGITGLEDISADTGEITDGINQLQMINKVTMQSASQFEMRYFEKAGSVLTRVHELFLRGVKDPRTQVKHYHGLVGNGIDVDDVGFEQETFSFLYYVTDNTMRKVEKAYFIIAAQPNKAETSIYETEKGNIEFKEIGCSYNGFPITGTEINKKATEHLNWLHNASNPNRLKVDSTEFAYTGISEINPTK